MSKAHGPIVFVLAALTTAPLPGLASPVVLDVILDDPVGVPAASEFGVSVNFSGGSVIVGVNGDDTGENNAGAAYVFDRATGVVTHSLFDPFPEVSDRFGAAVDIDGTTALVGVPRNDAQILDGGTAYLFNLNTLASVELINPNPVAGDNFGFDVALDGSVAAVGAFSANVPVKDEGAVYLFDAMNGGLLHTLLSPNPQEAAFFGQSIAMDNGRILIGARGDDTSAPDSGAAYLFDATTGNHIQTFLNPSAATSDNFGFSVALDGNRAVIGATGKQVEGQVAGAAYVFDATSGALVTALDNPTPNAGDLFGFDVAVDGRRVLVGARDADVGAPNAGSAFLFDAVSGDLLQTLTDPSPAANENYGYSVALEDGAAAVGALFALSDETGGNNGRVYIYTPVSAPNALGLSGFLLLMGLRRHFSRR